MCCVFLYCLLSLCLKENFHVGIDKVFEFEKERAIQVWNNIRVKKWRQNCKKIWVNYPFKNIRAITHTNYRCCFDCHHQTATRRYQDHIISELFEFQKPFHYTVNNKTTLTPIYSSFFNSAVNSVPHHKSHRQSRGGFSAPDTWSGSIKRLGWPHRRWTVKEQAQNSAGTHTSCLQLLKRVRPACGWSKGTRKHFTPWVTMKHTSVCLNPRAKTKQAHICMVKAQESNCFCQSRVQCRGEQQINVSLWIWKEVWETLYYIYLYLVYRYN